MPEKRKATTSLGGGAAKSSPSPSSDNGLVMVRVRDFPWMEGADLVKATVSEDGEVPLPARKVAFLFSIDNYYTKDHLEEWLRFADYIGAKEMPVHILNLAVIYINHFPEEFFDKTAGYLKEVFNILRNYPRNYWHGQAAKHGLLWFFKWADSLHVKGKAPYQSATIRMAIEGNNPDLLRYMLYERHYPLESKTMMSHAIMYDRAEIVACLVSNDCPEDVKTIGNLAVFFGAPRVLKWAIERRLPSTDATTLRKTAFANFIKGGNRAKIQAILDALE